MKDMDKIVTEVARKAVKEFLENLMNTQKGIHSSWKIRARRMDIMADQ